MPYVATYTIVSKADGSSAHAAEHSLDRLYPFCSTRSRLGRTVQGTVQGYDGIANWEGDLCAACRDMAKRIVASEAEIEARILAEGPVAGRTIRFVVEYAVPETATRVSLVTIRERLEGTLEGRDSYVKSAVVVSAEIV